MAHNLVETPATGTPVQVPDDSDVADAASVTVGFQACANRIKAAENDRALRAKQLVVFAASPAEAALFNASAAVRVTYKTVNLGTLVAGDTVDVFQLAELVQNGTSPGSKVNVWYSENGGGDVCFGFDNVIALVSTEIKYLAIAGSRVVAAGGAFLVKFKAIADGTNLLQVSPHATVCKVWR